MKPKVWKNLSVVPVNARHKKENQTTEVWMKQMALDVTILYTIDFIAWNNSKLCHTSRMPLVKKSLAG